MKESFEACRKAFIELARSTGGELRSHKIPSKSEPDLSFESLYLAPQGKKQKLLILTSGIHGVEGFAGSDLQRYFLEKNFFNLKDENTGFLLIHGINPYGFKYKRRVTENNVDLNRNFDVSENLFQNKNEGYRKLYHFLNPVKPYSRLVFTIFAIRFILRYGMESLRNSILKGQYEFPEGLFFGGYKFEPQVALIRDLVLESTDGFSEVLLIDLHTGYGEKGQLHIIGDRSPFIDQNYMNKVFSGVQVDYGQEKDFYAVTGGFTVFLARLLQNRTKFAGAVFEFGTINGHRPLGSLDSLYRMVNENQKRSVHDPLFLEMFYPESPEWKKAVVHQFETSVKKVASTFLTT